MEEKLPNWHYEAQFKGPVAGVDEAGRGPLAGPVIAAAVILHKGKIPPGLNDSKKLSAKAREHLYAQIINCAHVGIGIAEPEEIDRVNILAATLAAMGRAVADLPTTPKAALIDGNHAPRLNVPAHTIIKGDSKSLSIAASSIIAKTVRDRIMHRAAQRFIGYGFDAHKGYPTKIHKLALERLGPCPLHRRSYAPVKTALMEMNKRLKI